MKPTRYFDNARLAVDLALELGAKGTDAGSMSDFCATAPDWICPACCRTKAQIARLDKNGNFYCAIHTHHDHLYEGIIEALGLSVYVTNADFDGAIEALIRFPASRVCMDCNMAEGRAKVLIGAHKYFSFSPKEIREFVIVANRASHKIDEDEARRLYIEAQENFEMILEDAEGALSHARPAALDRARVEMARPVQ